MVGKRAPRSPFTYKQQGTDPRDSDEVRRAFFAFVGTDHAAAKAALAAIGWLPKRKPHWLGDGNIPWYWREKLWKHVGGKK